MSLLWKTAVAGYEPSVEIKHLPETHGGTYFAHDYGDTDYTPQAYLRYVHTSPGEIGLDFLHTKPARRRQGLATALMDRLRADYPDHALASEDASDKGQAFLRTYRNRTGTTVRIDHPGEWWDGSDWDDEGG
jgi:GNAT superfamily N-acetyltransferase